MTTVDYKILFEVRVLHDYYLFGIDPLEEGEEKVEKSYFSMGAKPQEARLQELLRAGRYDVRNELDFIPGLEEETLFRGLHLRMLKTSTGFYVAMEVKLVETNGGLKRFRPAIRPADGTALKFGMVFVNSAFEAISNLRLDPDSLYFFKNDGAHDGMSLAAPPGALAAGNQYWVGDLALVKNQLSQASQDNTADPIPWIDVSGDGFVHQGDKRNRSDFKDWLATIPSPSGQIRGIIDISLKIGNGNFSPLDANGLLATRNVTPHPVFELRFLSRSTYWRYRKMGGFSDDETRFITVNSQDLLSPDGPYFTTQSPRLLARDLPNLRKHEDPLSRIPNAIPGSLTKSGGKVYSEVYFNDVLTTKH